MEESLFVDSLRGGALSFNHLKVTKKGLKIGLKFPPKNSEFSDSKYQREN